MGSAATIETENILSNAERRIARLIAWGYIHKEIADKLHISSDTVSVHLRNIYRKLEIHKETDLTRWWIFTEYAIADSPFKRIVVVLFLALSISSILLSDVNMVRVFRSGNIASVTRTFKPVRSRRIVSLHELQPALTV